MVAAEPPRWKFSQAFGERTAGEVIEDVDIISAIEFASRGEYLATGDRGGRIVLFERTEGINQHPRKELEQMDYHTTIYPRYAYKTEFQSHEPEFDYLRSLEIGEKINKLRWCGASNNSLFFLSTNDRTIKLWKVLPYKVKKVNEMDLNSSVCSENTLLAENSFLADQNESCISNGYRLEWLNKRHKSLSPPTQGDPRTMFNTGDGAYARCRRVYRHAHDYNVNSISNNRLKDRESHGSRSFFTEIIASISDLKFAKDGRHILSRDYMNLKLWDMHMDGAPVATFKMHEFLRPKLSELYDNDSIFDKFDCCLSSDGCQFASGSYSNTFKIFSRDDGHEVGLVFNVSKNAPRSSHSTNPRTARRLPGFAWGKRGNENSGCENSSIISRDFTTKVIHMAWHPTADMIACASANTLYMYCS